MDLRRLREETRPEHEATEAAMPLTAPDLTVATYAEVLRRLLPVIAGWERWASDHAPAGMQPLLAARRRSHLLRQDLRCLGAEPESAGEEYAAPGVPVDWDRVVFGPTAPGSTPDADRQARFLGALYVLEGSTLGGRFLARHVEETLRLEPGCGNAYFQGHGEATGRMWRETTARLTALPEEAAPEVIATARRTFQAFGRAMSGAVAEPAVAAGGESVRADRTPAGQTAS